MSFHPPDFHDGIDRGTASLHGRWSWSIGGEREISSPDRWILESVAFSSSSSNRNGRFNFRCHRRVLRSPTQAVRLHALRQTIRQRQGPEEAREVRMRQIAALQVSLLQPAGEVSLDHLQSRARETPQDVRDDDGPRQWCLPVNENCFKKKTWNLLQYWFLQHDESNRFLNRDV